MSRILYLHGLASSGQSSTPQTLRKMLPDFEVLSPDIPVDPTEALPQLTELCRECQPDLVMGTSMGGMYAQQMHGYRKILINPAFHVSDILKQNMGRQPFFNQREDGQTEFEINEDLYRSFLAMEKKQFEGITAFDKAATLALFGTADELVNGQEEYLCRYPYAALFVGGHRLNHQVIEETVLPWIKKWLV